METIWQNFIASNNWIIACIDILVILILTWIISHFLKKLILRHCKTNVKFALRIKNIVIYIFAGIGILSQFNAFQGIMNTLLASGGIVAVVLGFAAQETMSNFMSGMMITTFKPFKIGDLIKVNNGEYMGTVHDISLRHTVILTFENTKVVIPNNVMNSATLENISVESYKTNFLDMHISYESDVRKAMLIIEEEVKRHPDYLVTSHPEEAIVTRLVDFEDSSLHLKTTIYSKNHSIGYAMLSDLRLNIKERFDQEGIEIPYPHRVIHTKNNAE